MSIWDTFRIGASALSAQSLRLEITSNNIANAETTRTETGGPYKRKDVVFTAQGQNSFLPTLVLANRKLPVNTGQMQGVKVTQIVEDDTQGARVYDPTHPDADEEGYVLYPNVDITVEMTNMLSASRSYEANLNVIDMAEQMAKKALEIGKS
jgi:flagellar basal-body rod protein FlgC